MKPHSLLSDYLLFSHPNVDTLPNFDCYLCCLVLTSWILFSLFCFVHLVLTVLCSLTLLLMFLMLFLNLIFYSLLTEAFLN